MDLEDTDYLGHDDLCVPGCVDEYAEDQCPEEGYAREAEPVCRDRAERAGDQDVRYVRF